MSSPKPTFALLGSPLPASALETIAELCDVRLHGALEDPGLEGVFVEATERHASVLQAYRASGGRLAAFAISAAPVTMADRLAWIRAGADDLLCVSTALDTLMVKLRSGTWRLTGAASLDSLATPHRVDRWLRTTAHYLAAREELISELTVGGRTRYLDCAFLRDQVARAAENESTPDVFGQRRGSERETFSWPIRVVGGVVSEGELINVGADGACLALPLAPGAGQRLFVEISGAQLLANVELEVRWQRRAGRGRWQVGAFGIACTLKERA